MDGRRIVQQALDAQRARDSHWMGPGLSVDQAMTALNVVSSKGMSPGSAAGREMVRQALDAQRVRDSHRTGAGYSGEQTVPPSNTRSCKAISPETTEVRTIVTQEAMNQLVPHVGVQGHASSPGGGGLPPAAPRDCEEGFEWNDFACMSTSWTEIERGIIDLAFAQLRVRMAIVERYFDQDGVAALPTCVQELLSGTRGLNDKLHISPDDTEFDPDSTTSTLGSTGAGSLYISLTRTFVQAVAHTYSDREECEPGSTLSACRCIVAAIAGVLLHETGHSCLLNEKQSYLLEYFYRLSLREELALGLAGDDFGCCGLSGMRRARSVSALSWAAAAYDSLEEVKQFVRGPIHEEEYDASGPTGAFTLEGDCLDKSGETEES